MFDGRVRLDVGHREVEGGVGVDHLPDLHRELHAAEVLVVGVVDLDPHVAEHGVRDDGHHFLDEVLAVDGGPDPEPPGSGERERVPLNGGVAGHRQLDDTVRRGPQLELPIEQGDRRRGRGVADHVPGEVAARHENLALFAAGRDAAAPPPRCGSSPVRPHQLVLDRGRLVAHRAREALDDEPGPRHLRRVVLPHLEVHAAARVLDGLDRARAHRLRDAVEGRASVLRVSPQSVKGARGSP